MSAALAIAAIGVWNVTHPVQAVAEVTPDEALPPVPAATLRKVQVELTVSPATADYEIVTGSGPSIKGIVRGSDAKCEIGLNLPAAGEDWIVRVHWKAKGAPTAVRVVCRDVESGQKLAESTFWGQGDVEDTVGVK